MKQILPILLLIAVAYKVCEPVLMSFRYEQTMTQSVATETSGDEIDLAMYAPMPYGSHWEETGPMEENIMHEGKVYNVVSRRFANDTLYLRLKINTSAVAQYEDMHNAFDELIGSQPVNHEKNRNLLTSLNDLLKLFSPPNEVLPTFTVLPSTPRVTQSPWIYTFFFPDNQLTILSPPPQRAA